MPSHATPPRSPSRNFELAAVRYLAGRERTEAQVKAYLSRAGASAASIRSLLSRFRKQGYLDDEAYAVRWACARLARCPMGRARLEAELSAKGFERTAVATALRQAYADTDERAQARALLALRTAGNRRGNAALLRRYGFDDDLIEELSGVSESS
jgi:SOS response regulatory protein OraA/RecX